LDCFKGHPEKRLGTQDIIAETGIPRRTVIHALNQLLEGGFLKRLGQGRGVRYQLIF
jgi:DNA-binding IclR family transcriptional regulator